MTEGSHLLYQPLQAGALHLPNRILMAPLTRQRMEEDGTPSQLAAEYYAQRASAGLIIAEATQVAPLAKGFDNCPGIWNVAQRDGWRRVVDRVRGAGGRIVLQLWHAGRAAHPAILGAQPVAPSAITIQGNARTAQGFLPHVAPRALSTGEIREIVAQFAEAADLAQQAGFDGVELHGANGYLIEQFLADGANRREDEYGGTLHNRLRFLREVLEATLTVWPADRVGIRFSPFGGVNDCTDSQAEATWRAAIRAVGEYRLAYLHLIEPRVRGNRDADEPTPSAMKLFRKDWDGVLIAAGGFTRESAVQAIAGGYADAIAFGRLFISNPDLVTRLRRDAPLVPPDRESFYTPGAHGYTDYPVLEPVG